MAITRPPLQTYWYIATPYARYPHGHAAAYRLACSVTAQLARQGYPVFSPIAHGQGLSDHGGIGPTDHDVWMTINEPLMKAAHGVIVIQADGWEDSRGIAAEVEFFESAGKPVVWMGLADLIELPTTDLPPTTESTTDHIMSHEERRG